MRKIIHVDMDCFYAAIEAHDHPQYRGRPLAVAYDGPRSVVTTASYEARPFGVRSAMALWKARELCPGLLVAEPRFAAYKEASLQIRAIFADYTDRIQPLSLDEAFLDVSDHPQFAWAIAREIRTRIREVTGLTASAGIAANKMLAKIASDWRKPDGQFAILPQDVDTFMPALPVGKLGGVGPKMRERLAAQDIHTCGDLQAIPRLELLRRYGSWGGELHDLCRGIDDRPVDGTRIRKSLSNERTYDTDLQSPEDCRNALDPLIGELEDELRRKAPERPIAEAVVKVKFADFRQTTRQCRCPTPSATVFHRLLAEALERGPSAVRLLGVGVRFEEADDPRPRQLLLDIEKL